MNSRVPEYNGAFGASQILFSWRYGPFRPVHAAVLTYWVYGRGVHRGVYPGYIQGYTGVYSRVYTSVGSQRRPSSSVSVVRRQRRPSASSVIVFHLFQLFSAVFGSFSGFLPFTAERKAPFEPESLGIPAQKCRARQGLFLKVGKRAEKTLFGHFLTLFCSKLCRIPHDPRSLGTKVLRIVYQKRCLFCSFLLFLLFFQTP